MKKQMTIQVLRDIVSTSGYIEFKFPDVDYTQTREEVEEEIREFGGKLKGTCIDIQTANMLVTVYDALNEKSHEKFDRMLLTGCGFGKLVEFGWKRVR